MNTLDAKKYLGELVELYLDDLAEDNDSFTLGYVHTINDDFMGFMAVGDNGALDSIEVIKLKHVSSMVANTPYTSMYERFVSLNKNTNSFDPFELISQTDVILNLKSWNAIFSEFHENNRIMTFVTSAEEDLIVGYINNQDMNTLDVSLFDFDDAEIKDVITLKKSEIILIDILGVQNYLIQEYLNNR